jgi:glycosyltransferase involved in cell wall biosynthesis/peptidoglycan/xylan/chitin deacetylase (PgdA/CDA1 family)
MRSLISLTFDDGLRCQFEQALPILNQYGLPATFFLVANTDRILKDGYSHPNWNKTDWSEKDVQLFKSMVQQGHEIGAHGVHHRHPFLDRDPKLEAEGSKKWIEDRVGVEISSYCYPLSHFTYHIKRSVIDAAYKQARWGDNEGYYPLRDPVDHFKVDCRRIGKYGAENVADWLRPGCWHVLMFHGIGTANDGWCAISVDEFARQMAELAEYRESGAVEVVTFKEGAQTLRRASRSSVKSGAPGPRGSSMKITVIVCTYNRCQILAKTLESIAAQTVPEPVTWEVLVVDNNSIDQTGEVIRDFCRHYPGRFRHLSEPQQGLSYARNTGIRNAQGEILAFADDDAIVEPDWLWNLTSALKGGEWAGAGGRIIPLWSKPVPSWLSLDGDDTTGPFGRFEPHVGAGALNRPAYGGNMAFRRETFDKYGGFRVDLGRSASNLQGREDLEFCNRLFAGGEKIRYEPQAIVHHLIAECRMERKYVLRWWFWYGRSEVADVGPPPGGRRGLGGVPLYLFRRLLRWAAQSMISTSAPRRFACWRNVWYLAGTIAGCFQWSRRIAHGIPAGANVGAIPERKPTPAATKK